MGQLYHLTQRNTHPYAEYDRKAFNRRQTILLSSEDVGLMGLNQQQYQKQLLSAETQAGLTDRQRRILALDDPQNDAVSLNPSVRSGFLK